MSAPKRIQLRRVKGWRLPDGAVVVGRPGKWGNPFSLMDVHTQYPSLDDRAAHGMVVAQFRDLIRADGCLEFPNWLSWGGHRHPRRVSYPSSAEIRGELAGHDLACWCDLGEPCHADVLLELANRTAPPPAASGASR